MLYMLVVWFPVVLALPKLLILAAGDTRSPFTMSEQQKKGTPGCFCLQVSLTCIVHINYNGITRL
ncbi:hypothetical protein J3F83DRAFT_726728 [Trichoderma novae-zelandiae]